MGLIDDALSANATLAAGYDPAGGGPPKPKMAIVTCADPRLSGILRLLGLAEADVDMIRNVGTVVDDDVIRSLVVSTRVLGTKEIMIINHNLLRADHLHRPGSRESGSATRPASSRSPRRASTRSRMPRRTPVSRSPKRGKASLDLVGGGGQGLRLRRRHRPADRGAPRGSPPRHSPTMPSEAMRQLLDELRARQREAAAGPTPTLGELRAGFLPIGRPHAIPDDVVVTEAVAGGVLAHWLDAPGRRPPEGPAVLARRRIPVRLTRQ